jgi:3-hydroxyisobutyrate dehydrogenase-like beta-hydroxyacid dehydrogenase
MSVAVVGAGNLGGPIARRLIDVGYDVTVCDRNDDALAEFRAMQVRCVRAASECAAADLVLVLVATPDQARSVLLGDDGLAAGVLGEHRPVVGIVSTVSREVVLELENDLVPHTIPLVDVPVSGGPPRALDGTLTVLAAGEPDLVSSVEPVLAALGQVFPCGELGGAQVLKLINNVVCAANVAITGEVLRLATACGLDLDDVMPVLDVSTGRNFLTPSSEGAQARLRGWTATRAEFDSLLAIVRKDVGLAVGMAEATGTGPYEGIEGLHRLLAGLGEQTYEHWRIAGGSAEAD